MSVSYKSSTALATSRWQHLAVTVDQTNERVTFFLDNKPVGIHKASKLNLLENSENITIGRNSASEYFNGMMDDVRIYSRVLSAEELSNIFNYKNEGSLIAKYDFEKYDFDKMELYDEGPYGYNGSLVGVGANSGAMSKEVSQFAIKHTSFKTLADEYVEIDGSDPSNKLQGARLNNCTFAAWVKLASSSGSTYEPIIAKEGVFSFGVNSGRACLKLGDGATLHELPIMTMPEMNASMEEVAKPSTLRVVGNGYSSTEVVPRPVPASSYFKSMGYNSFEWNFVNTLYENSSVFKLHTVDARSKTANTFSVDDPLQMAAGFGGFSSNAVYTVRNWCRDANNEYWYLRAGFDGMAMPDWTVGKVPITVALKFKFLDLSNFDTSAVSILFGLGGADEGFSDQTWSSSVHENRHMCAELFGNAATSFQMRCSVQDGMANNGRSISSTFTGNVNHLYGTDWNYMILVHDPANTKTTLYLNHTEVCSVSAVSSFPEAYISKLRVGAFPIESTQYQNRGIHIKGLDLLDTAMSEELVAHYIRNRHTSQGGGSGTIPRKGLMAHYTFDGDQPQLSEESAASPGILNGVDMATDTGLVEGSSAVRLHSEGTNLEISGEVFSSEKTFFFGTWINADALSGYRPILSRAEGEDNMQFGLRNGQLELSLSKSKPATFSDISAKHVLDYATGSRLCEVSGSVSNSKGGVVYLGLFGTAYSDLMKEEVRAFVETVKDTPNGILSFDVPGDAFGVSIASTMTSFFSDIRTEVPRPVEQATQHLCLLVLMVDVAGDATLKSYTLRYERVNNQTGEFASRKSEVYLSDGYTYAVTTMREAGTPEEYTDWYLVMNYLRKENENVRAIPRAPKGAAYSSNQGYEGFPLERQRFDSIDMKGAFASESYEEMDLNAQEYGPWGHANNELFGMLVDHLGDHGAELLFKGKTDSHDRVMNFSTGWSWLVDYFRNGFEVAPGGFNHSTVKKRPDHTTYLPDETTSFPDNKMDLAMSHYPFYHNSYRNYSGADNNSYWSLDENAQNSSVFQQIWVRGRREQAARRVKPALLSGNDYRNKSLPMGQGLVSGEPYTMTLLNGDTVEMSSCYDDNNKKVSNMFSHSMNDNNHSTYGEGDSWRAIYTFKETMEVVSMKFYQAESYQTKDIAVYYTTDDTVTIRSPLESWTPVSAPSATEFHSNTSRTVLRIDFSAVKASRFMIATSKWNSGHSYYGLMEWMIFGYHADGMGVISDMSDKNVQHNNAGKFERMTGSEFQRGTRSIYHISDTEDPYRLLFLKHMSDNRGASLGWNGNDTVVKAQLNNDDVIYYNCVHSYAQNTGWHTYDATNLFKDESVLNVVHQNSYNSYQQHGWMFARSDSTSNRRTGSLIYEFANGRPHKIRGLRVWGQTQSSKGFSAKVRVFFSMFEREMEFVEFGDTVGSISLLETDTSTYIDLGASFPISTRIMIVFESCWDENVDVVMRQLQILGSPVTTPEIIQSSKLSVHRTNNVVVGRFRYTNTTGKAKLYAKAYSYEYTGGFSSSSPTMTLLPTSNKVVEFELSQVQGIDGEMVPAKAVNYIKLMVFIEDSVYGSRRMLNTAYLLPNRSGEMMINIESLMFDSYLEKVTADVYAYSAYSGITGIYTLLTEKPVEEEDEVQAKSFILQNASVGLGCVDYKAVNVVRYGICSESFAFAEALTEIGGVSRAVADGRSYYLNMVIQDSNGSTSFSKRIFPTKMSYFDLDRIFAEGRDHAYGCGFGDTTNIRSFGEGGALKNWLSANTHLVIRELVGGNQHGYLWCYDGDRDLVYAWGYNANGELAYIPSGTSHNTSSQPNPVECNGITNLLRERRAKIVQFKSGSSFGLMLLSDGKMYGWGNHSKYATGLSENKTHLTIEECDIFRDHCADRGVSVVDFACAQNNTVILFSDGTVWGIGDNTDGLLGLGHTSPTGGSLTECTNVNRKLEDGYEIDLMCARGTAMTYRLKRRSTGELSWWGMGENRHNRALGTTAPAPVVELTRLDLMEELIASFPDPTNYVVAVGPSNWSVCGIIDLSSNSFWYVGYSQNWGDTGTWTDRSSSVNMSANKLVFVAMHSYGFFFASTKDTDVVYNVPDTRSIITSNRMKVTDASTAWSPSTGVTFTGSILGSDLESTSYTFYATSELSTTIDEAVAIIATGASAALQTATLPVKGRISLKDHVVRSVEVRGAVVPSGAYPTYKLFAYAESGTQRSMAVLTNEDESVEALFANVLEGSYDPFQKTLKVRASVTDALATPTKLYVAAFAQPPGGLITNADVKEVILRAQHLPQVKTVALSGVNTGEVFVSDTLAFAQVFDSVYPQLDEATYRTLKATAGTDVVSGNSDANASLSESTSDASWYVWSDKYQSGQTVKKWTLGNGDSVHTNAHGAKWFDGDLGDDASYQPQMYSTSETWTVEGTSRDGVRSWRYFYDVAEPRTVNAFKLWNHGTNGAHFLKTIGVWNAVKQIYETVPLTSGSFPLNCFANQSTSAYADLHVGFEPLTLEPGRPLMIHLGRMATNLYIREMQLLYETPPPVIPTFFRHMKLRVRANNGHSGYSALADLSVPHMEVDSVGTTAPTAHGHAISRTVDGSADTYHQTENTSGFDVLLTFTHGLPAAFDLRFVSMWNDQAWKDVDVYVSTDGENWMLSKEVRGLGFAEKHDLAGRTTTVSCALPPEVLPAEDREYSIYAVAENSLEARTIRKFAPPPAAKAYLFDRVKSLGYNNHYETGQGTDQSKKDFQEAIEVTKFLRSDPSIRMIDIVCGGTFTIFEVRNNGRQEFYGLGYNSHRGLGGFEDSNHQYGVVECTGIHALMSSQGSRVRKVACGWYHTMVLLENGKMYGFGYNAYGQLGTNDTGGGGTGGRESVMVNDYCADNNTEVVDFACTAYNTFVYLKNNSVRVAGRWNGHGQFGRGDTSETSNSTFYHVSHLDAYLGSARIDFMKCEYGSVMYRVVNTSTGEAKWYGAGQNSEKSIGYSGGQTLTIVECDLLNDFIDQRGLRGNYEVIKGIIRGTMLIDTRDGKVYGIGHFDDNNDVLTRTQTFAEMVSRTDGTTLFAYDALVGDSSYPMRPVKYATNGYGVYVGGTDVSGPQPFEYLETPTGNLNILRINNVVLTAPDRKGLATLAVNVKGSIIGEARYYVALTTDDRAGYDFDDEANAAARAGYSGVIPRTESLSLEVALEEIPDVDGKLTPLALVSKVRAYVFVTDGTHRDYQVYDFGPYVSHPTSVVSSVYFSPMDDAYRVDMRIGASREALTSYNVVVVDPEADFPDTGEPVSYDRPLIVDSYRSYDTGSDLAAWTLSGWVRPGARSLMRKPGAFEVRLDEEGRLLAEIETVHRTAHLERLVETPAASTLWRFKLYTIHGGHSDYATFTQLVLTDAGGTYPTARYDQGADTLFDGVGETNTNLYRYNHGHRLTYEYASEFTPTKLVWAYKSASPTRAPTRLLLQYCTTTNRGTEADWRDYLYVNLEVKSATNSTPTFHALDINVAAPNTPRTITLRSAPIFGEAGSAYEHVGLILRSAEESVVFHKNGTAITRFEGEHLRIPAVDQPFSLDTSANTRYLALRKGALSSKNLVHEHFGGREDLISLVLASSAARTVNLPVGKYASATSSFTSALASLEGGSTSVTVVPGVAYRVLSVLTDVNGSTLAGDAVEVGAQYTTISYGWASGHNNNYNMMFPEQLNGNPDFHPTSILNSFLSANPSYKCLDVITGGYAVMCMIQIDGAIKLYSTGYNGSGQIGNGNTSHQSTMVEATLFNEYASRNNTSPKTARCGWDTSCVLYENGTVMCVGGNTGSFADGTTTNSSGALVEASLVTAYCREQSCDVVDFAVSGEGCCYLFSNGKVLGNRLAMGTSDNSHNGLKETGLNAIMGSDYECTLMRCMHASYNFRITHKTTGEEQWYGSGEQYYNGGGAAANQRYDTALTRLTKLEALLASFEDPKDYTYVMGVHRGGTFVRDNRAGTFWRIGYFDHISQFGSTTEFAETSTYITKEWCETNGHSRLTNFTPVYWRMNAYGIFAFGNPVGVEPEVIGGSANVNLTTMSIQSLSAGFAPPPEEGGGATSRTTVYVSAVMKGSKTQSTYYAVATLNSGLDSARMSQLITSGSAAVVSGKLERNAEDAPRSVLLKSVLDHQTELLFDVASVPSVYVYLYLRDENGVADFDSTGRVVRAEVDLQVPYVHLRSATYQSGAVEVRGTLFNSSSALTGYYLSAFKNAAEGAYAVSAAPTALPPGESMLPLSASASVPSPFLVTLRSVYEDDSYAASSEILGNEGTLALRLIATDGAATSYNDFDYAMGDFISSTQAVYASTNEAIAVTVNKKNATEETSYQVFASLRELSVSEVLKVITDDKYAADRVKLRSAESACELTTVIAEDRSYPVADVSAVSVYSFGTDAGVGGFEEEMLLTLKYDTNADYPAFKDLPRIEEPIKLVRRPFNPVSGTGVDGTTALSALDIPNMFSIPNWGHHYDEAGLDAARVTDIEPGWAWLDSVLPNGDEVSIYHSGDRNQMRGGFAGSPVNRQEGTHPLLIWDMRVPTFVTKFRMGSGSSTRTDWRFHGDFTVWWSEDNLAWHSVEQGYPNDADNDISSHKIVAQYFGLEPRGAEGDNFVFGHLRIAGRKSIPQEISGLSVAYSVLETRVSRTMPSVKIGETEIDEQGPRLIVKDQLVSAVEPDSTLYTFGLKLSPPAPAAHTRNVSAGGGKYLFDGVEQPTLTMYIGDSLNLVLSVPGHPLWIKAVQSTGASSSIAEVVNNGSENGVLFWTPSTVGTYYYNCQYHAGMRGAIRVLEKLSTTHLSAEHVTSLANTAVFAGVPAATHTAKSVSAAGGRYLFDGADQPAITLYLGDTLTLALNVSGHPLWIKSTQSTGVADFLPEVVNNGSESGELVWTPTAVGTYYYNCQYHAGMRGVIQVSVKPGLPANVRARSVESTELSLLDTPLQFEEIFTSVSGETKPLEEGDNVLVVSLLRKGDRAGFVSRYALVRSKVDVSGVQESIQNGHSILTDVSEEGFSHRNTQGGWSYYTKLDAIGSDGIRFSEGAVFEYKTDRVAEHRYQPFTLLQEGAHVFSAYCSFYDNRFQFATDRLTGAFDAEFMAQLELGAQYKRSASSSSLEIVRKDGGNFDDVTHLLHRFLFVDHPSDPALLDLVFEFLDQDRNLIFRSRVEYLQENNGGSFGGNGTRGDFQRSMTGLDLRLYTYTSQKAIRYSDFSIIKRNADRDSFTPLVGTNFGANSTFSS